MFIMDFFSAAWGYILIPKQIFVPTPKGKENCCNHYSHHQ
jgi:hypothetical protein